MNIKPIFCGDFADQEHIEETFYTGKLPPNVHILVADLRDDSYSSSAYVLFEQDGKLFEVCGSHCSCYDYEGQWEPEETSVGVLWAMTEPENMAGYLSDCANEIRSVLAQMES